jgi:hypothetical protein
MDNVYLPLGSKAKYVNLRVPLAFIIGDNQGGDGIAGRAAVYNETARRISRSCDATVAQYDTISSDCCSLLDMEKIKALVIAQDWKALFDLHQAPCWNPFFDLCYGGFFGGIFTAACPAEALHALENGLFLHALKAVLGGCLKPQEIVLLDAAIQQWCKLARQRLMRSSNFEHAPRLLFKDGISTLTKLPAATKVGMMFALVVAAVTRDGKKAFHKLSDDEYNNILYSFEQTLCYWAWLKKDHHWSRDDTEECERTKVAIAEMLQNLTDCIPRLKGRGWDIPKLHEQLHVAETILLFGSHKNIHTGPAEHNHIELSKKTAVRTQMRKETFDWQVANRLVDKLTVDLSLEYMSPQSSTPAKSPCVGNQTSIPHNAALFDLFIHTKGGDCNQIEVGMDDPKKKSKFMPPLYVLQHLVSTCYPFDERSTNPNGVRLCCCTELQLGDTIVRAHPTFYDKSPWFDYVTASFINHQGHKYESACRVELIYFFPDNPQQRYVVVHPAFECHYSHSVLTSYYRMEYEDDPIDIMDDEDIIDSDTDSFHLDDDFHNNSCPRLKSIQSEDLLAHKLMIPYHSFSKFMIGVKDQTDWANEFLTSK